MPELTIIEISLFAVMLLIGLVVGWLVRARRCAREKIAVSGGWQAQMDSQQSEHDRLAGQNKSLMEQISQYQASNKDTAMRAKELSDALKASAEDRDRLQRQLKEVRGNLEIAIAKRDRLKADVANREALNDATVAELERKDEKILKLNNALKDWQERVPPLVERFRERDQAANELSAELQAAHARIADLEQASGADETRIEPVDANSLPSGLYASNEPHDDTAATEITRLQGQLAEAMEQAGTSETTRLHGQLSGVAPDQPAEPAEDNPGDSDEFAADAESAAKADSGYDGGGDGAAERFDGPRDTSVVSPGESDGADGNSGTASYDDTGFSGGRDAEQEHGQDGVIFGQAAATDDDDRAGDSSDRNITADDEDRAGHSNDETATVDDEVRDGHPGDEIATAEEDEHDGDLIDQTDTSGDDGRSHAPGPETEPGWLTDTRVELTSGNWWDEAAETDHQAETVALEDGDDAAPEQPHDRSTTGFDAAANELHDDLKQIKGVGPAIEKTLNDLGICRFNQIAEISEYDIDRIAQQLRGFRSRIYREDWIGQARSLHYQKNNDPG